MSASTWMAAFGLAILWGVVVYMLSLNLTFFFGNTAAGWAGFLGTFLLLFPAAAGLLHGYRVGKTPDGTDTEKIDYLLAVVEPMRFSIIPAVLMFLGSALIAIGFLART